MTPTIHTTVAIIGGGPAGLMAAQTLAESGVQVDLYDGMPSVGRKFLLAGKGGMNLTHSEPLPQFMQRYGAQASQLAPWVEAFGPDALREWAKGLGIDTFVGTSGRVFPTDMKAAPLLRAWLHRLRTLGVRFHMRHRWTGWNGGELVMTSPSGQVLVNSKATVLALGGASWPRLGSDGAWQPLLADRGVALTPLQSANCGFDAYGKAGQGWTPHFVSRFAGQPFKSVAIRCSGVDGDVFERKGEFVATATGVEGSLVYAASRLLREQCLAVEAQHGGSETLAKASFLLDLLPAMSLDRVLTEVSHPRGTRSLSSHLKSRLKLDGIKAAILYELLSPEDISNPTTLARAIKGLPIQLVRPRPVAEAISTAGGVRFDALDDELMLRKLPNVFCAGEMLDWEAPTGGYLLTASFATGRAAGLGVLAHLGIQREGE